MRSLAGLVKIRSVSPNSTSSPAIEEAGVVGDPRRLLHVVRDDDDRVVAASARRSAPRPSGWRSDRAREQGSSISSTSGWLPSARAMQSRCCWPPDSPVPGSSSRSFTSSQSAAWRRQRSTRSGRSRRRHQPVERRPVGHVVEDRLGERVGPLEHHADPLAQRHEVGARREDRRALDQDVALVADARDQVVEPVDRAEEGGLAAARRADDRGDRLALDREGQVRAGPAGCRTQKLKSRTSTAGRRAAGVGRRAAGAPAWRGASDEARLRACARWRSSEPPGDVGLGLLVPGRGEDLPGRPGLDHGAQVEEGRRVGDPGRLLHVVGHDDDREVAA